MARCAAAGINAGTATALVHGTNLVLGTSPGGGGLLLPVGINLSVAVVNKTGVAVSVHPPAGVSIDALGASVALLVAAGTTEVLHSPDGLAWTSE